MLDDFTRQGKSAATQWFNRVKLEALFSGHGFSGGCAPPLAFPGVATRPRPKQAAAPTQIFIHPPNENMKIRLCSSHMYLRRNSVVPEKIHTPPTEEISAVRRGRGDIIVSDNSKCIRTSKGGRGVNLQFPLWGWYGCFLE